MVSLYFVHASFSRVHPVHVSSISFPSNTFSFTASVFFFSNLISYSYFHLGHSTLILISFSLLKSCSHSNLVLGIQGTDLVSLILTLFTSVSSHSHFPGFILVLSVTSPHASALPLLTPPYSPPFPSSIPTLRLTGRVLWPVLSPAFCPTS